MASEYVNRVISNYYGKYKNIEYVVDLEEKCNNEVYEVISELKTELNKLSGDTEIINILENAYEEEKELKKSYYLSLYNE